MQPIEDAENKLPEPSTLTSHRSSRFSPLSASRMSVDADHSNARAAASSRETLSTRSPDRLPTLLWARGCWSLLERPLRVEYLYDDRLLRTANQGRPARLYLPSSATDCKGLGIRVMTDASRGLTGRDGRRWNEAGEPKTVCRGAITKS
jgi:hypothetical protein